MDIHSSGSSLCSAFCPHAYALNVCEPVSDAREPVSAFRAENGFQEAETGGA